MNRKILVMVAIAATVMSSCTNEEAVPAPVPANDRVAVQFSSGIANIQTRVKDDQWEGNESIGIYMLKDGSSLDPNNISEGVANRQYETKSATSPAAFTPAGGVGNTIYYPVTGDVNFIAYYPHSSSISADYKLGVSITDDQSSQLATDVLYAPAGAAYSKTSGQVTLPFEHKLAKLEFNISNDAGVTEPLADLKVKITGQPLTGKLNLTDGTVGDLGTESATITPLTVTDGTNYEAIVLPASTSNVTFTFTNKANETFVGTVPDASWVSGNKYTYTVTLTKKEAIITGTISPWGTNPDKDITAE